MSNLNISQKKEKQMEQTGFFKWIWRINAIGMLLLLGAGLYSFIKSELRNHRTHTTPTEPITSVAKDPKGVEKWVLEHGRVIHGTDYTMVSLVSKYSKVKNIDKIVYYQTSNRHIYNDSLAKNILFINTKNNNSSWLFKTNNQLIVEYNQVINFDFNKEEETLPPIIYYKVIDRDTNGDKITTLEDKQSFAVSDISGANYKVIIRDIERIISKNMISKNEMHMVYQKDGVGYSLKFDTDKFETISDVVLPKVGE